MWFNAERPQTLLRTSHSRAYSRAQGSPSVTLLFLLGSSMLTKISRVLAAVSLASLSLLPLSPQPQPQPQPQQTLRHTTDNLSLQSSPNSLLPKPRPTPQKKASRSRTRTYTPQTQTSGVSGVWQRLASCESGGRWDYNGSSGYDGGLQFSPTTWRSFNGTDFAPYAYQATPSQQITVAKRVLKGQGWGAWPSCSSKLGLR